MKTFFHENVVLSSILESQRITLKYTSMLTTNDMGQLPRQAFSPVTTQLLLHLTPNLTLTSPSHKTKTAELRLTPQTNDYPILLPFGMHIVLQINCQSLVYDIICITETWLHDQIFNNEILPTNYTIYRNHVEV